MRISIVSKAMRNGGVYHAVHIFREQWSGKNYLFIYSLSRQVFKSYSRDKHKKIA